MRILVSGSTGLLGSALLPQLRANGHEVWPLVRRAPDVSKDYVLWDIDKGFIEEEKLEGFDAVIHLAGENVGERRWSAAQKERIFDSRVKGTELLVWALEKCRNKPETFLCASAVGIYGSRGEEVLTEESRHGNDFLAEVCKAWEGACSQASMRVVNMRFGMLLSKRGGALAKMLLPFRLGLGGVIGSGDQVMSWIDIEDAVGVVQFLLLHDEVSGPVNVVSPNPVSNYDYTKTLASVLGRPAIFPLPAFMAKLVFGERAEALMLSSTRVKPTVLKRAGYEFRYPEIRHAFEHVLLD